MGAVLTESAVKMITLSIWSGTEKDKDMIPKTIHYCWFGRGQKPKLAEHCIASWRRYCPDYRIVEWNEDNFDIRMNGYTRMCYEQRKYAFLSDYARLVILEKEGGIYLDTDVQMIRSFDRFLKYPAFFGFEDDRHVNTGIGFGAEAGNETVREMLAAYDRLLDGTAGVTGCPILNTQALVKRGLELNGQRQHLKDAEIFPAEYFNPYDDPTGRLNRTKKTCSIHWYAKSWMSRPAIIRSSLTKPIHRVFGKDFFRNHGRQAVRNTPSEEAADSPDNKIKILIFSHAMELGGAERALLGLLEAIDYDLYEVDLFLMRHEGELLKYIPREVHLLAEIPQYACLAVPAKTVLARRQYAVAAGRAIGKWAGRRTIQKQNLAADNQVQIEYSHKYTAFAMPAVSEREYDLAVSFLTPHYFTADKVKAKKKAAWIHTDYGKIDIDRKSELEMWNRYDHIISVSEDASGQFLKKFPTLKDKLIVIHNMLPADTILRQAEEFSAADEMPENGEIRLLSVGRFCHAKNFDNIPDICGRIRAAGLPVHWYIIGYGSDEEKIAGSIKTADMQDYVTILGKKENPYPYIKACDFYVQPSHYEGYSVSVKEAQLLCKPVIITEYPTAKSQVRDGVDGIIVPMENGACADAMIEVLREPEIKNSLIENCRRGDYSNRQEVDRIKMLMD